VEPWSDHDQTRDDHDNSFWCCYFATWGRSAPRPQHRTTFGRYCGRFTEWPPTDLVPFRRRGGGSAQTRRWKTEADPTAAEARPPTCSAVDASVAAMARVRSMVHGRCRAGDWTPIEPFEKRQFRFCSNRLEIGSKLDADSHTSLPATAQRREKYIPGSAWRAASVRICDCRPNRSASSGITKASMRFCTSSAKAASMSGSMLVRTISACPPKAAAADFASVGLSGSPGPANGLSVRHYDVCYPTHDTSLLKLGCRVTADNKAVWPPEV
jgi:hypothetical protein